MTPPILTNEGVSNYLQVLEGMADIPDHHNMAIFQLADKFTLSVTSRVAVCQCKFLLIDCHAGASRILISKEEREKNGGKILSDALMCLSSP